MVLIVFISVYLCDTVVFCGSMDTGTDFLKELKEGETIRIIEDNSIRLASYDKIATTKIRYRTIGYTLKQTRGEIQEGSSTIVRREEDGEDTHEDKPELIKEGYMITYHKVNSTEMYDQIDKVNSEWVNELYNNGGGIYLDGILTINQYDKILGSLEKDKDTGKYVTSGEVYRTAPGIKSARGWMDPDVLDTHFNKYVYFYPLTRDIGAITASLSTNANPSLIQRGVNASVEVTLDSSKSSAKFKELGKDMTDAKITNRKYWIKTNDGRTIEPKDNGQTISVSIDNVNSETTLYCTVRVYSQDLADLASEDIVPQDEATVVINLGQKGGSSATGNLNADLRGNEKYNVLQGIPTQESLYANITTEKYLTDFSSKNVSGTKKYPITIKKTYNLSWQEDEGETVYEYDDKGNVTGSRWVSDWEDKSDTVVKKETYYVDRDYIFNVIDKMGVYALQKAVITNKCLPSGSVTILPNGYTAPEVVVSHSDVVKDHIKDPVYESEIVLESQPLSGGRSGKPSVPEPAWQAEAEAAIGNIQVKNDKLIIDGFTVLEDDWHETRATNPREPKKAGMVGKDVLYKNNIKIDAKTLNDEYESTGTVYYNKIAGVNNAETVRTGKVDVNPVIVHAPVVCDPVIENDVQHNQEIKPDDTRAAMILGRTSKFTFPTVGKYINKKGYVNADYRKYTKDRIVKFPFDVYVGDKFLKANTEYHMPAKVDELTLTVPTWVNEGNYDVQCRTIAINSPGNDSLKQNLSNISYKNYIATKTIPVRVIGRVYGLKITDINDYPDWAEVFRTSTNTTEHSDNYYWVGDLDEDGQKRGNSDKFTFPVLNGSHITKKNLGVLKTGYKFKFELNTIGNYFNDSDLIRIKPRFYYVKKDGSGRKEVDLWYQEKINGTSTLAKVGSKVDSKNIKSIVLGDPYRNVPDEELTDTSDILENTSKTEFTNQKAKIGSYGDVILSKPVRTFVGDTSDIPDVDEERVKKSVQKWYGEYCVPNNAFVCEKGLDVADALGNKAFTGKEKFWLKNGYIIVNFEIETIKNKDAKNPQLSYWGSPHSNMWKIEGFDYKKKDGSGATFTLSDGDIIFYYTDKKSSDDYSSGGTN